MMRMKQFLHKLRNVGAFVCACIVVFTFFLNIYHVGKVILVHMPVELAYMQIKSVWVENLSIILFVVLGNCLLVADNSTKADYVGYSGLGGLFSFAFFGFAYLVCGLAAHKVLVPILIFCASMYICIGIYVATRHFAYKLRNIPLVCKEEYDDEFSNEKALSL